MPPSAFSESCGPKIQDYYACTAAAYAKNAGFPDVVELLGGHQEAGEVASELMWAQNVQSEQDEGPSGGLWLRHLDEQAGLWYLMNDETGLLGALLDCRRFRVDHAKRK